MFSGEKGFCVLVCGGRRYADAGRVRAVLDSICRTYRPITRIIHGGQSGADALASMWAECRGRCHMPFLANWDLHGRRAGPLRNQKMLDQGKPDLVVAFPGGRGTADMVRRAKKAGVEIRDVGQPQPVERSARERDQ